MKKPSSKIREEITRLQDQLKAAETREAERIGRVALKAGLGDIEIEEAALQAAFEEIAKHFRTRKGDANGKRNGGGDKPDRGSPSTIASGAAPSGPGEA